MTDKRQPFYRTRGFAVFVAVSGVLLAICVAIGRLPVSDVLCIGLIYLIGSHWVYPFLDRRLMAAPYTGSYLYAGKDDELRFLLFLIGGALMVMSLFAASGAFESA